MAAGSYFLNRPRAGVPKFAWGLLMVSGNHSASTSRGRADAAISSTMCTLCRYNSKLCPCAPA
eukprot:scaffold81866_cov39-Tisochrysis_lutea.AAC.2